MINGISGHQMANWQIPEAQIERPEGYEGNAKDAFVRDEGREVESERSFRQMGELFLSKKRREKQEEPQGPSEIRHADGSTEISDEPVCMFEGREGYKADFLGVDYALPTLGDSIKDKAAHLLDSPEDTVLNYSHFSLVMNKERRQCFFTAVNIDGTQLQRQGRSDNWVLDGRIAREYQLGNEAYSDNTIDRGHMVRRRDPAWGTQREANVASNDTFVYTNSGMQCEGLNQKEWLHLEDHVLLQARGQKMTVLTGPVLSDTDRTFTNHGKIDPPTQIPDKFWKMVVWNDEQSGQLKGAAFVLSQSDILDNSTSLFKGGFTPGEFDVYQVPIDKLEQMTDLHFAPCQDITGEAVKLGSGDNCVPQGL